MSIQWRLDQQIVLHEFEVTLGFHCVDVINVGEVHSMILCSKGNYEFSTEMIVTRLLPPPYNTSCVHYDQYPLYSAYMSQTVSNYNYI